MKKRLLAIAPLVVLLTAWLTPPAAAQEAPILQPVVDGLNGALDEAQPLFDGLEAVTEPLGEGLTELIGQLEPLFTALNEIVSAAEPACAVLGPVLEQLQPVIDQLQPVLDQLDPATAPEQLDFLDPLLTEVDGLADQALTLCAAQVETTTTTSTTAAPAPPPPPPAAELPRTGGPALLVPGGILLGLGALLGAARRRL